MYQLETGNLPTSVGGGGEPGHGTDYSMAKIIYWQIFLKVLEIEPTVDN